MEQRDLIRALVRVWGSIPGTASEPGARPAKDTPKLDALKLVGTGILVSKQHALSCAHVVAAALKTKPETPYAPTETVWVDLPASAPGRLLRARVVVWHARVPQAGGVYDIAGLELLDALPVGATPAPLVTLEASPNTPCRAFGFPAGRPDGAYAEGTLKDVLANGWVMLRGGADAREFTRPGYSGGPIYTERGVVGMLTEGEQGGRVHDAAMIPTRTLFRAWPELVELNTTCPYRGLSSFRERDARFFYGRGEIARTLAAALSAPPHLAVLAGASGSGKSSLLYAGMLPQLREAGWRVTTFRPGPEPFSSLSRALLSLWQPGLSGSAHLVETAALSARLRRGDLSTAQVMVEVLAERPDAKILIALDQAEELLTRPAREAHEGAAGRSQASELLEGLLEVLKNPALKGRVALFIGVRTDFLDALAASAPSLGAPSLGGGTRPFYLGAVDDLREVIAGPLRALGLGELEPGLTTRILDDLSGVPNPLPLLEFTLTELWARQSAGKLTHSAYDELGGAARALAGYAQGVFEALDAPLQTAARRVFLQLMQPSQTPDGSDKATRRVATFTELGPAALPLVKTLADKHLIVTGRTPEHPDTAEVVHEMLFEHWPLLRGWIQEGWAFRRWQEGLRAALSDWERGGRRTEDLLAGAKLSAAEAQRLHLGVHRGAQLSAAEDAFIERSLQSRAARAQAERVRLEREARRQRRTNRVLSAALALALLLSSAALWQWRRAEAQTKRVLDSSARLEAANVQVQKSDTELLAATLSARGLLATQTPSPVNGDPRLGALLAAHAVAVHDNVQSRGNLLRVLQSDVLPHSEAEPQAELSPDARLLVVAWGAYPTLWDVESGELRLELGEHELAGHVASSFAFSPSGDELAVGGADGRIRLWNTATGEPVGLPLEGHAFQIVGLRFSPDARHLVSVAMDGAVQVWALRAGSAGDPDEPVAEVPVAEVPVAEVRSRLSRPPAPQAAEASGPPVMQLGSVRAPAAEHLGWLTSMSIAPEGDRLALALPDGSVGVYTFPALRALGALALPQDTEPRSLAFGPGGVVAVGGASGEVALWDARTRRPLGEPLAGFAGVVSTLAFSPDAKLLAAGSSAGQVQLWSLSLSDTPGSSDPQPFGGVLEAGERVYRVAFSPRTSEEDAASTLYVRAKEGPRAALLRVSLGSTPEVSQSLRMTAQPGGGLELLEVGSGALGAPFAGSLDDYPQALAVHPSSTRFATRSNAQRVRLWNTRTRAPVGPELTDQQQIESLAYSPDGRVLATGDRVGWVVLRDPETGEPLEPPFRVGVPRALALAFRPNSAQLAVGTEGGVRVWDLERKEAVGDAEWDVPKFGRDELVWTLAYTPSGETLLAGYAERIYRWDAATLKMLGLPLRGEADDRMVRQLSVSPDGRTLAASYNDSERAAFWDLESGLHRETLWGVAGLAFSPDGEMLATGRGDGSLTFWEAQTLEPLGDPVRAHTGELRTLAFSPDGRALVTGGFDNSLRAWAVDLPSWLSGACARAKRNLSADEWRRFVGERPYRKTCPDYPAEPAAVDLLLEQAARAATRGNAPGARTLQLRALSYALELGQPELVARICLAENPLPRVAAHCAEENIIMEVSGDER